MSRSYCKITSARSTFDLKAWKNTKDIPSVRSVPDLKAWKNTKDIWSADRYEPRTKMDRLPLRKRPAESTSARGSDELATSGPSSEYATAEKRAPDLEAAGRYRSREAENHVTEAAAASAEIDARTEVLKGAHVKKVRMKEKEVLEATEWLIAQENAKLMSGHEEEAHISCESSQSTYDEPSDDERPASIVEDILEGRVARGTPLVRMNSNAARSEAGVVVRPKESWKAWFRRVFRVPDGSMRRSKKLKRKGRN